MASAATFQPPTHPNLSPSAGRDPPPTDHHLYIHYSAGQPSLYRPSSALSTNSSRNDARAGATRSSRFNDSRVHQLRQLDSNMASHSTTSTLTASRPSSSGHAKLRKRGGSTPSLPGPPSPYTGTHTQFTTPFATYEEPLPEITHTTSLSGTPKIKPYLRKMSTAKDDQIQGKLDLSRSTTEFDPVAGLGINETGTKTVSDVTFAHAGRRGTHTRDTSASSQISNGSGSYRPNQPFVHPMRLTPRPYTPPAGQSYPSSLIDEEASESHDVVADDEFKPAHGFISKRSMSISSFPQPTPLSQSHTAEDLAAVPRLKSPSQTNLSIRSTRSMKSLKLKPGRPRGDSQLSNNDAPSPSSRTSLDKAFSFVSKRSDTDSQTREDRIRAARRKFDAKEAEKDRRAHRRQESLESRSPPKKSHSISYIPEPTRATKDESRGSKKGKKNGSDEKEKVRGTSYDETRPARVVSLSQNGTVTDLSEKSPRVRERKASVTPQGGWVRFSAWLQTRLLDCGGR